MSAVANEVRSRCLRFSPWFDCLWVLGQAYKLQELGRDAAPILYSEMKQRKTW